jgi:hypothetical protein
MRGAVTGVGLLNIGIAFWEIFHFRQTVRTLEQSAELPNGVKKDAVQATKTTESTSVSHHERSDDLQNNAGN